MELEGCELQGEREVGVCGEGLGRAGEEGAGAGGGGEGGVEEVGVVGPGGWGLGEFPDEGLEEGVCFLCVC